MDLIHFRMVVPPDLTQPVLDLLAPHDRVLNLVVVRAAHVPDGDAVECDVLTGAANGVLADLRGLGVDRTGSIAVDDVDMMFSERGERIAAGLPGALAHAPLWAAVEARIRKAGTYPPPLLPVPCHRKPHGLRRHHDELADPHRRGHGGRPGVPRDHQRRPRPGPP